jgi:hypothetical protein
MLARSPACGHRPCCAQAGPSARFLRTGCAPISTTSAAGSGAFSCAGPSAGRCVSHAKTREPAAPLHLGTCQSPAVVHNNLLRSYTTIVPISCSRTQQHGSDCSSSSAVTHGNSHLLAQARDRRPAAVVIAGSRLGETCAGAGARGRSAQRRVLTRRHMYCVLGNFAVLYQHEAERVRQTGGRHLQDRLSVVEGRTVGCLPTADRHHHCA